MISLDIVNVIIRDVFRIALRRYRLLFINLNDNLDQLLAHSRTIQAVFA